MPTEFIKSKRAKVITLISFFACIFGIAMVGFNYLKRKSYNEYNLDTDDIGVFQLNIKESLDNKMLLQIYSLVLD